MSPRSASTSPAPAASAAPRTTLERVAERPGRVGLIGRRAATALLTAFVVLGATGALGVHSRTTTAVEDGTSLEVTYARIARAGHDVPWRVRVDRAGGFGPTLTLAVTAEYFTMFESQGLDPEPSEETRDGDWLYLTFDAPDGTTFVVDFDAYVQPASQRGRTGTVAVLQDGTLVAPAEFRTTLLP